jgi:hypothetical protein
MKKQQELSGATALNFVENLEARISQMENDAAENWQQYYVNHVTSEFFTRGLANMPERQEQDRQYYLASARERILSNLRYYLALPSDKVRTKEDAEHLAYRIQLQKAAQRICDRYGIELN